MTRSDEHVPNPNVDGKTIFNEDARLYARARPGYPEEMFEEAIAYSRIPEGGRILEIGCGPGQATYPFARRGYRMLCVEPGPNMVEVASERCSGCSVEFVVSSFEDWPVEENAFDLAISASAFHWLDKGIRLPKIARALKSGGTIALFWNKHPGPFSRIFVEANAVYRKYAPELAWDEKEMCSRRGLTEEQIRGVADEIDATGIFGPVTVKTYPWSREFTAQEYADLMNTYSGHRALPEDRKQALFADIRGIIEENGGIVVREYLSVLYLARKK